MIGDLPKGCAWEANGTRRNAAGHGPDTGRTLTPPTARSRQLSFDVGLSARQSGGNPLAKMTGGRVTYLYELMDSAYDAPEIHRHGEQSGHVPIIDVNPRRDKALKELKEMEPKARAAVNIPRPQGDPVQQPVHGGTRQRAA